MDSNIPECRVRTTKTCRDTGLTKKGRLLGAAGRNQRGKREAAGGAETIRASQNMIPCDPAYKKWTTMPVRADNQWRALTLWRYASRRYRCFSFSGNTVFWHWEQSDANSSIKQAVFETILVLKTRWVSTKRTEEPKPYPTVDNVPKDFVCQGEHHHIVLVCINARCESQYAFLEAARNVDGEEPGNWR